MYMVGHYNIFVYFYTAMMCLLDRFFNAYSQWCQFNLRATGGGRPYGNFTQNFMPVFCTYRYKICAVLAVIISLQAVGFPYRQFLHARIPSFNALYRSINAATQPTCVLSFTLNPYIFIMVRLIPIIAKIGAEYTLHSSRIVIAGSV